MEHELTILIAQYGLLAVFLSALLEQAGLPVPALPVLVVAGAAAAQHQLPILGVVVVAFAGCLLPDLVWYRMGRHYGTRMMHGLCRISLSPDSCVHRSELHFERWRGRSLIVAKFVPGLSVVAPPLVGALGLPLRTFLLLDGIGALLWTGLGVGLGLAFATQVDAVLAKLAGASHVAVAVLVALLAVYVATRWLRRRQLQAALGMPRIGAPELQRELHSDAAPLVLDVRSSTSRQLDPRAIAGARLADPDDLAGVLHDVPPTRNIVTYCSCPNEATSALAARRLRKLGYAQVRPLAGGLPAWEEAGGPTRILVSAPVGAAAHATR